MALVSGRTWHARSALDEALIALARLSDEEAPTREVAYHLQASLQMVYAALAQRDDRAQSAKLEESAQQRARVALVLLEGWEMEHQEVAATQAVRTALAAWSASPDAPVEVELNLPSPRSVPGRPTAAHREPLLLVRSRQVLHPAVILPETVLVPPGLPQFSEDETDVAPPPLPPGPPAPVAALPAPRLDADAALYLLPLSRRDVERHRAHDLFEDLAMLGNMRRPSGPWRDAASPERRLLARVEGIVACGQAVWVELVEALSNRPVPDADLLWAALFFFGSLDGDDARDQVLRLLRTAHLEEPDLREAAADALLHAPHPGLRAALHGLLESPGLSEQLLALRVLGRRRALPLELLLRRFHSADDPTLTRALAEALIHAPGTLQARGLHPVLFSDDADCVSPALATLVQHRQAQQASRAAADFVREGRPGWGDAALWLAITASADALPDLKAALAGEKPPPSVVEAAGWFGSVELVEPLLELLRRKVKGAAQALQRITGASLTDALPTPEYEPKEEPFTPGHRPELPVPDLSGKTRLWTAWWKRHGKRAKPAVRYRFGHPWTVADNLWEMADAPISTPARGWAHAELVARTGLNLPLDVWEFVERQQEQLEAWKPQLEKRVRASTGTWLVTGTG